MSMKTGKNGQDNFKKPEGPLGFLTTILYSCHYLTRSI